VATPAIICYNFPMEDLIKKIKGFPLFAGIKEDDYETMMACISFHCSKYQRGDYVTLEEEHIKNIGIIMSGSIDIIKEDLWGGTTILLRMRSGEMFGETFACAVNSASTVTFIASADTKVLFMPFTRVMHSCSNVCVFHHRLIENMVSLIAAKNRDLMQKIEVISKKNLRDKIMTYLSMQAQTQGKRYFDVPMGRLELADYLCADRSALTRELSNMKKDGLIDYDRNTFHLKA
jgi:CRP-like cAMP-binding protein